MLNTGGYEVEILVQGYPGKTTGHGGLGWSTVTLLRGHGRVAVLDTGPFSVRTPITEGLARHGLRPEDVTDLLLSHLHHDHVVNWPMFPKARMVVGGQELAAALQAPDGDPLFPELYVRPLATHARVTTVGEDAEVLPGVSAHLTPGHSPGHLTFVVHGTSHDLVLVQDAAKYRAELITREADMTYDPAVTAATIERIWGFWRRKPGSIVVTGHDLPMVLQDGVPRRIGRQTAAILGLFGETIAERTRFDLAGPD